MEEFFKALGSNAMKSSLFRQYITIDIYFCVVEFLEGLQFNREEIESLDDFCLVHPEISEIFAERPPGLLTENHAQMVG